MRWMAFDVNCCYVIDRNRKRRDKPQARVRVACVSISFSSCGGCLLFICALTRVIPDPSSDRYRSWIHATPSRVGRRCATLSHSSHTTPHRHTRLATGHRTRHMRYPHVRTCASRPWSYLRSDAHDTYQGESPLSSQARHCLSPPHPSAADCDSRLIASRRRSASRRHRHRRTREPSLTSSSR